MLDVGSYTIVVWVAVATSLMTPVLLREAMRRVDRYPNGRLWAAREAASADPERGSAVGERSPGDLLPPGHGWVAQ